MNRFRYLGFLLLLGLAVGCGGGEEEKEEFVKPNNNDIAAEDVTLTTEEPAEVTVTQVVADFAGFVVVLDDDGGSPGEILGHTSVPAGTSNDVEVDLNRPAADGETLYARLHLDAPSDGVFTFEENAEEDLPARNADDAVVVDPFTVTIVEPEPVGSVRVEDQVADPLDRIFVASATAISAGHLVVYELEPQTTEPATVIGSRFINGGTSEDVSINLSRDIVDGEELAVLLHIEANNNMTFEPVSDIAAVDNDGETVLDTFIVSTPPDPFLTVEDQTAMPADVVNISELFSDGDGYVVVYETFGGETDFDFPLGVAPVSRGMETDLQVTLERPVLDGELLSAVLHAEMDGEPDKFDGPTVDPPVSDGVDPIAGLFTASPSLSDPLISASDQFLDPADQVRVDSVIIDTDGWVVIRESDGNGDPGNILGQAAVAPGALTDVVVSLSRAIDFREVLHAELYIDDGNGNFDVPGADMQAINSNNEPVADSFEAVIPEGRLIVADQTLDTVSTQVTVDGFLTFVPGYIVVHEDVNGAVGDAIGVLPIPAALDGPVTVELERPAADGEALIVALYEEQGGNPSNFDGATTDPPVVDSTLSPVTESFTVSVPATTPAVIVEVANNGAVGYLFRGTTPERFYDEIVDGSSVTNDPPITLRQGWRYAFELGQTATSNPIEFGSAATDSWLFSLGTGGVASFENDPNINWVEDGTRVIFTATQTFGDEVTDYRSKTNPSSMMGTVTVAP